MLLLTSRCRGTLQQARSLRLELTPEAQISVTFPDEATRPAIIVDADQTAIVRLSKRVRVEWIEAKALEDAVSGEFAVNRVGTLSAAHVTAPDVRPFVRARFRQLPEVGWTSCCA